MDFRVRFSAKTLLWPSCYYNHGQNICEKLYISRKIALYGKRSVSWFCSSLDKIFISGGRCGTRL